jgi:signal transduction histidine kinase
VSVIESHDETGRFVEHARYIVTLIAAVGLALTIIFNVAGSLEPAYQNRSLHVAKETAGALVLVLVAALLFGRFRRSGRLVDLLALAGVVVLAGKNLVFSVLGAILLETSGGLTTWRTTGAGMLGAGLLAAAGLAPERVLQDRRRSVVLTTLACIAALGTLIVVADIFELPAAFTEEPETRLELQFLSQNAELLVADAGATVLFLVAGAAFAGRAERERDEFQLWLAAGAIIAAMAYLNYVLFPSSYTDFLYMGDMFRVVAVLVWGVGTIREVARYQAGYARTAVLDERRRVARDIHDGVAQELAFIASQARGLRPAPRDAETTALILDSVQRALDESRAAISALSRPIHAPFHSVLAHTAEEVAGRLGARLELDIDRSVTVPPAWEEALPRIMREAVANAVRHGGAQRVTVRLQSSDGVSLRISDDGEGFDVSKAPSDSSFGLIGMRERTESLGGSFRLSSRPGMGTSVEVRLP